MRIGVSECVVNHLEVRLHGFRSVPEEFHVEVVKQGIHVSVNVPHQTGGDVGGGRVSYPRRNAFDFPAGYPSLPRFDNLVAHCMNFAERKPGTRQVEVVTAFENLRYDFTPTNHDFLVE